MKPRQVALLAMDLDGTLLRSDKTVSDYTLSVLERCRKRGIRLAVATARPIRTAEDCLPGLCWDGAVFHSGAVIRYPGGETERRGIPAPTARRLLDDLTRALPRAALSVEMGERHYANFDPTAIWPGLAYAFTDFSDLPEDCPADKILIRASTLEEIRQVERYLPPELHILLSENTVGMILRRDATKLEGVRRLAERYGLPLERVAAFGDDYGDIPLLRACGVGVAVENGLAEVKAASDAVCPSNDADGVAHWLEENLLQSAHFL